MYYPDIVLGKKNQRKKLFFSRRKCHPTSLEHSALSTSPSKSCSSLAKSPALALIIPTKLNILKIGLPRREEEEKQQETHLSSPTPTPRMGRTLLSKMSQNRSCAMGGGCVEGGGRSSKVCVAQTASLFEMLMKSTILCYIKAKPFRF